MKDDRSLRPVWRLLLAQLIVGALIALGMLITAGKQAALSALLGGLVAFLPSLIFARKLFQYQGARAARQIIRSFYLGEFLKIISSIALFTLVFVYFEVTPLAFFLTYIVVVMIHWFSPLLVDNRQNRPKSD
ncbi:ATP synthase subunit I [Legionella beliardensis]|uniref:ATP synthase subunit I n=1 Tax=Legionella beliardensis TaxID=91822 RepID=A0A378I5D0_9GAMM|nr:F0F1 ATP synthase subunit I [Legionella beliardensis]STX30233.1 ATP synthase subunit I [Legionella beliardensis]